MENTYSDEKGLLRGATGAIVEDGSDAFKGEVMSRIEMADRRIGVKPIHGMAKELISIRRARYAK